MKKTIFLLLCILIFFVTDGFSFQENSHEIRKLKNRGYKFTYHSLYNLKTKVGSDLYKAIETFEIGSCYLESVIKEKIKNKVINLTRKEWKTIIIELDECDMNYFIKSLSKKNEW